MEGTWKMVKNSSSDYSLKMALLLCWSPLWNRQKIQAAFPLHPGLLTPLIFGLQWQHLSGSVLIQCQDEKWTEHFEFWAVTAPDLPPSLQPLILYHCHWHWAAPGHRDLALVLCWSVAALNSVLRSTHVSPKTRKIPNEPKPLPWAPKIWWWSFEMVKKGSGVHLGKCEVGEVRQQETEERRGILIHHGTFLY